MERLQLSNGTYTNPRFASISRSLCTNDFTYRHKPHLGCVIGRVILRLNCWSWNPCFLRTFAKGPGAVENHRILIPRQMSVCVSSPHSPILKSCVPGGCTGRGGTAPLWVRTQTGYHHGYLGILSLNHTAHELISLMSSFPGISDMWVKGQWTLSTNIVLFDSHLCKHLQAKEK